jgi:L-arabinose isomerase
MNDAPLSFEAADGDVFGDILSQRPLRRERLKAGFLGVAYFEYWRMFSGKFKEDVVADLRRVADRLSRDFDLVFPCVVDTLDAADRAGRIFADSGLDLLIVMEGTYTPDYISMQAIDYVPEVPLVMFTTQVSENISPEDNYETLMRNSALIGTAQLSGTFVKMGRKFDVVVGSINEERPYGEILQLARVRQVASRLRQVNIGIVGHVFRGMYDLENDKTKIRGSLGPNVIYVELSHLLKLWEAVPDSETWDLVDSLVERFRLTGPRRDDLYRSCKLAIAMERLTERLRLDALCFLGQHYIEKHTGAPARIGASLMLEKGKYLVASEGDLAGLAVMHAMYWLTGNSPLQAEWGQYDAAHNALLMVGHGVASPALAGGDDRITLTGSPEEWGFQGSGVNMQFIMKPGPVTMAHLLDSASGWQMLITEGEALDYPCLPCGEIHALVKIERPVKEYLVEIQRQGVSHHAIIVHGSIGRELELLASVLRIRSFKV